MGISKAAPAPCSGEPVYGANLTRGQFIMVVVALALGTILEWYDFFVYSMLNSTLSAVFFPSINPTVQQVSFWGVFFVGFVARPIGSVIFGHIGDTRGRRLTLLLSIVLMAVPTVLIGCLPSYAQAGVAAPVLLALLRLVQGLAMGGEFGSALVYLHEIASKQQQGFTGSIGFASAISGCMLGVLAVMILELALTPAQMLLWGWRLPFLASLVSASAALALRLHMPEPHEFIAEQAALQMHHDLPAVAPQVPTSRRVSSLTSPSHSLSLSSPSHSLSLSRKQTTPHMCDIELGSDARSHQHHPAVSTPAAAAAAAPAVMLSPKQSSDPQEAASQDLLTSPGGHSTSATAGCCSTLPVAMLLRWYWAGVLLHFLFEAWVSISFYTLTTWLPNQMALSLGLPVPLTRGMLIVNLLLCVLVQLAAGAASDRGLPRVWSAVSVYVIAGAIIGPVLLYGMRPGALGAVWVLHALLLALVGWVLGLIPAACSPIYPASVRATGFNLAHNMAMSWLGGLSPTIVTALTAVMPNKFMAPTVLLVVAAGVSALAGLALMVYAPATNRRPADAEVLVEGQ